MPVFLSSKLSQPEQHQLAKLGEVLGGRMADTFSSSGSAFLVQFTLSVPNQASWSFGSR